MNYEFSRESRITITVNEQREVLITDYDSLESGFSDIPSIILLSRQRLPFIIAALQVIHEENLTGRYDKKAPTPEE